MRYACLTGTTLCLLLSAGVLHGQESRSGQLEGQLHVDVVVTDATGKPVSGLRKQDFELRVDNKRQGVASFVAFDGVQSNADPPTQMILIIDSVNNGFVELGYIRQGLTKFLRQNNGHLAQPTTILRFVASGIQFLSRTSTDGNALAGLVDRMGAAEKPQGLDSYALSLKALESVVNDFANEPGRKLLVWLGRGWPTPAAGPQVVAAIGERDRLSDFEFMVQLAKGMQQGRIALDGGYQAADFYMRGYLKPVRKVSELEPRDLALSVLAIKSGGHGELPTISRDSVVMDELNDFVAEASTFYSLSFDPAEAHEADEFHELKVVVDKTGVTARTVTGYYDEPEASQLEPKKEKTAVVQPSAPGKPVALRQITVAQLTAIVQEVKAKPDERAAKDIEQLQLTERLSSPKLTALTEQLPRTKAKSALMAVGDASVFLEPPPDEIPQKAAPDLIEQQQMMGRAVDYLKEIIPKLPDFYAERFTTSFEDVRTPNQKGVRNPVGLQPAGQFKATVYVQKGKEVVHADGAQEQGLITRGTFGPILSTVVVDASNSKSTQWNRWEEGPHGPMAVFQFDVPQSESHYAASFNPVPGDTKIVGVNSTAYHGEIGIDSNSGSILRLVLEANDLGTGMSRADIMVEYGAVAIGGKEYTCPIRSVSIATGESIALRTTEGMSDQEEVTRLNDMVYSDYHVFRSEVRIVP